MRKDKPARKSLLLTELSSIKYVKLKRNGQGNVIPVVDTHSGRDNQPEAMPFCPEQGRSDLVY